MMRETEQISRTGLAWILVSQAAILAPHVSHAPLWLWAIWLPVIVWRIQIFRGAWNFPGRLIKVLLVGACCAGLLLTLRGKFGMQGMVSLLLVGFILKLLEMKKRRDFLAVCYLGYFVIATQFLFFSNLFAAIYGLACLFLLTTSLLAVNQSLAQQKFWRSLRLAGGLLLQAIPLMLLLFFVLPRVGPLWSVPLSGASAKSGMSDSMSPGDISELMSSDELAFRATFLEGLPRIPQLYWRGLVFSQFNGRRWSQAHTQISRSNLRWTPEAAQEWFSNIDLNGPEFHYEIIMEPSYQPWLFTLDVPRNWDSDIGMGYDLRLQKKGFVSQRFQYRVTSVLDYRYQASGLPEWQHRQELGLPPGSNPETRNTAQIWMREAGSAEALIARVLSHYRESFTYTLQPSLLGEHSVDEFLWQTRAGFCEHFASSFVFFMRAAGIPARVVVGYQGGSYNKQENYWVVRQRDAHAWAEVWLEGKGWIRVDPTAAVAPERIERGIDFSLSEEDSLLLGNLFARRSSVLNQLSMRWDAVNYHWSRWVLNYDNSRQQQLLSSWLGGTDLWRIALLVLVVGAAILMSLMVNLLWRRRPTFKHREDYYYARFNRKLMARIGLGREVGEAPRDFALRIIAVRPDLSESINQITKLYELASYSGNQHALADLARAVTRFSPASVVAHNPT